MLSWIGQFRPPRRQPPAPGIATPARTPHPRPGRHALPCRTKPAPDEIPADRALQAADHSQLPTAHVTATQKKDKRDLFTESSPPTTFGIRSRTSQPPSPSRPIKGMKNPPAGACAAVITSTAPMRIPARRGKGTRERPSPSRNADIQRPLPPLRGHGGGPADRSPVQGAPAQQAMNGDGAPGMPGGGPEKKGRCFAAACPGGRPSQPPALIPNPVPGQVDRECPYARRAHQGPRPKFFMSSII